MLLDLQLQDGSGIEVCRAVRSVNPSVSGLLLTAAGDDVALAAAVLAGAAGWLVKMTGSNNIVSTIRNQRPGSSLLDTGSVEQASVGLRSVMSLSRHPLPIPSDESSNTLFMEGRTARSSTRRGAAIAQAPRTLSPSSRA